jgi:hypothetical protein
MYLDNSTVVACSHTHTRLYSIIIFPQKARHQLTCIVKSNSGSRHIIAHTARHHRARVCVIFFHSYYCGSHVSRVCVYVMYPYIIVILFSCHC